MFELDEVVLELIVMGKKGVSGENLVGGRRCRLDVLAEGERRGDREVVGVK